MKLEVFASEDGTQIAIVPKTGDMVEIDNNSEDIAVMLKSTSCVSPAQIKEMATMIANSSEIKESLISSKEKLSVMASLLDQVTQIIQSPSLSQDGKFDGLKDALKRSAALSKVAKLTVEKIDALSIA